MDENLLDLTCERLRDFFQGAATLSAAQVRTLSHVPRVRALTRLSVEVDRDFIMAVASGAWSAEHEAMAAEAHLTARAIASRLAPFGRRRRLLSTVLEDAALVVLADCDPAAPLPEGLRQRLASAWSDAMGSWPGAPLPSTTAVGQLA